TLIAALEDAMDSNELIEVWEANLEEPAESGENKFKGMYFQGYLTEIEYASNAEDMVEVSLTFGINGSGKRGDVTVTTAQQEMAEYAFTDTVKTGE
ncbi:MAG: phage major tail protein, TP901-1 family, partial [Clostridiales bacterium]|nr:phage major tail protein, TP901-1 family [Clostridiales bacterium]